MLKPHERAFVEIQAAEAAKNTAALIEGTVAKVNTGAELVDDDDFQDF